MLWALLEPSLSALPSLLLPLLPLLLLLLQLLPLLLRADGGKGGPCDHWKPNHVRSSIISAR